MHASMHLCMHSCVHSCIHACMHFWTSSKNVLDMFWAPFGHHPDMLWTLVLIRSGYYFFKMIAFLFSKSPLFQYFKNSVKINQKVPTITPRANLGLAAPGSISQGVCALASCLKSTYLIVLPCSSILRFAEISRSIPIHAPLYDRGRDSHGIRNHSLEIPTGAFG